MTFIKNNNLNKKPNERIHNKGHTLPSKPAKGVQYIARTNRAAPSPACRGCRIGAKPLTVQTPYLIFSLRSQNAS